MARPTLPLILLLMTVGPRAVDASALIGPACFVKVQVEDAGAKQRKLDSGSWYDGPYLDLRVLEVLKGAPCPVLKNRAYRAIDNNPGALKKGQVLKGGVESGSSMGPEGPVSFLQWSQLTLQDGSPIVDAAGHTIDSLQSGDQPLKARKPRKRSKRS